MKDHVNVADKDDKRCYTPHEATFFFKKNFVKSKPTNGPPKTNKKVQSSEKGNIYENIVNEDEILGSKLVSYNDKHIDNDYKEIECTICDIFVKKNSWNSHVSSTLHLFNRKLPVKADPCVVLGEDNKGYQLAVKMGWNPNEQHGLGVNLDGRKYPIKTKLKHDAFGLGHKLDRCQPLRITHFQSHNQGSIDLRKTISVLSKNSIKNRFNDTNTKSCFTMTTKVQRSNNSDKSKIPSLKRERTNMNKYDSRNTFYSSKSSKSSNYKRLKMEVIDFNTVIPEGYEDYFK